MSHSQFKTRVAADTLGGGTVLLLLIIVGATAPLWLVGLIVLGLVPLVVVGVLAGIWWTSRRRESDFQDVRAAEPSPHLAPPALPEAAPTWEWPRRAHSPLVIASGNSAGRSNLSSWDRPAPTSFTRDLEQA